MGSSGAERESRKAASVTQATPSMPRNVSVGEQGPRIYPFFAICFQPPFILVLPQCL